VFPAGDLRSISLHWTAADYEAVFAAYHFCVRGVSEIEVVQTADLRGNMRDVRAAPSEPYAAHTAGRNSWSIGIAVCAMADARPDDFGRYPLLEVQIAGLCTVARALAGAYAIPLAAIRTHAEAALDDGYFGAGDDDCRWDIARLEPSASPLAPEEAVTIGNFLRQRIAAAA